MALVWSVLLAAPMGYRSAGHVAITAFIEGLPRSVLYGVGLVVHALILWICSMFLFESAGFVGRGNTIISTSLGMPMSFVYVVVPMALTALILVALEALLRLLRALVGGESIDLLGVSPIMQDANGS